MRARQNLTIALSPETIRKAKVLAARRNTSVTGLVATLVERLVEEEERYETAQRAALSYLEDGFPLGGQILASREQWHER
ncbi:MAG: hypothetical protein ACNA8S_16535 [Deferrisomatales bacterium]